MAPVTLQSVMGEQKAECLQEGGGEEEAFSQWAIRELTGTTFVIMLLAEDTVRPVSLFSLTCKSWHQHQDIFPINLFDFSLPTYKKNYNGFAHPTKKKKKS